MISAVTSLRATLRKPFLTLLVASVLPMSCYAKGPAQTTKSTDPANGLVLTQTVQPMGERKVLIRKDAIKVINYAQNVGFLAKAPDWRVYTYNEKRQIYVDTSLAKFVKKLQKLRKSMNVLELENPEPHWQKQHEGTMDGVQATLFFNDEKEVAPDGTKHDGWRKYWVAYKRVFPRPIVRLLAAEYGVPNLGGVPIHFETFGSPDNLAFVYITSKLDGKLDGSSRSAAKAKRPPEKKTLLRTTSAKVARIDDAALNMPKGMKRVAKGHSHEVLMDDKADKAYKDMLEEPDFLFRGGGK